jgi:aminoglycoside phosphotransferase (APT) family kinase protein
LLGQIPVPEVLHVGESADGVPFVVMTVVDGVSLRQLKKTASAEAIAQAAHDAGRQLARLASIVPKQPDLLTPDLDPALLRGSNVNARVIDHFCESPRLRERLRERDVTRVHDFAWQRDERLAAWPGEGIAHGDFNASNIFVHQRDGEWRISGILDWEFAFAGSSCYDIGNFLRYERADRPCFEPHFSRGLADGGVELPNDWRTTARLADLGALCELLTRATLPANVVEEVRDLIRATLDENEIAS